MFDITTFEFYKQLKELNFIEAIYLFGSRVGNDYNERSDIDIAISCPNASDAEWQEIMNIIEVADTLLKIDYVKLEDVSDDFKSKIIREGKQI